MLEQGTFASRSGDLYTIYRVTSPGFLRVDICLQGAAFQTEPHKVLYSTVTRKSDIFTIGKADIYREYSDFFDTVTQLKGKKTSSSEWDSGEFISTEVVELPDGERKSVYHNGALTSTYYRLGGVQLLMNVIASYTDMRPIPTNFASYQEVKSIAEVEESYSTPYYPLSVLKQKYDLSHLDKYDFCVCSGDDMDTYYKRLEEIKNSDAVYIGLDTETTGLEVHLGGKDKLVGVVVGISETWSTYFTFGSEAYENLPLHCYHELMDVMKSKEGKLLGHNTKFDRQVFLGTGYDIFFSFDTEVLGYLVEPNVREDHSLKGYTSKLSGEHFLELNEIFINPKMINFAILPKDIVKYYACPDSCTVITLHKHLLKKLPVMEHNLYFKVEAPLANVKADSEFYGLRVDEEEFWKSRDNCDYTLDKLEKEFRTLAKFDGNLSSDKDMSDLIYNKMRCEVLVRTDRGQPSVSAKALEKLASVPAQEQTRTYEDILDLYGNVVIKAKDLAASAYPAIVVLLKYRYYFKRKTAFYARFERTSMGGRVFFWVNQNGAESGRQSSPMHQLPPELKKTIISDSEYHELWDADYSQMELRMIAFLAGERDLCAACEDPENDIHRVIDSLIMDIPMWAITSEMRKAHKRRNFGVVYLISEYGLAVQNHGVGYTKEQLQEAKESLDAFYNRFKHIRKFIAENKIRVQKDGYIKTRWNRVRYFPELFEDSTTARKRAGIIRSANNMPVQGSAADYLKVAEVNFYAYIRKKGWNELLPNGFPRVRIALSIHDEVLIMADKTIPYEEIMLMVRQCMQIPVKGAPPFFVSPGRCDNWAQHDDDSIPCPVLLRDKLIEDYLRTGVSVINSENYIETLDNYRESLLRDYMDNLVATYPPDEVWEHVRHPTLTHSLIERFRPPKTLSHLEQIKWSTEAYIKGISPEHANSINTSRQELQALDTTPVVQEDDKGTILNLSEVSENTDIELDDDDTKFVSRVTDVRNIYVFTLGSEACIDISTCTEATANEVIKHLWENKDENGFYNVSLALTDRLIPLPFRVEDLDIDHIVNIIIGGSHGSVQAG